jgi:hypothetical protein
MSYCLNKHRSWPIDKHNIQNQYNYFSLNFCPIFSFSFSSIRSFSRHFNLQSCHGSSISTIQTSLGRRRSTSSLPDDAPNYCRSRQHRRVRFLNLECPISPILNRGFWLLSDSCGNTFESFNVRQKGMQCQSTGLTPCQRHWKCRKVVSDTKPDTCLYYHYWVAGAIWLILLSQIVASVWCHHPYRH